jgi:hypothetical protein
MSRHDPTLKLIDAQRRLAVAWFATCAVPALLFFYQTNIGMFVDRTSGKNLNSDVWHWFFTNVGPTLTSVIGVLIVTELNSGIRSRARSRTVTAFFYRFTLTLSMFYLLLVAVMPLMTGQYSDAEDKLRLLNDQRSLFTILQSLLSAALSVFFISSKKEAEDTQPEETEDVQAESAGEVAEKGSKAGEAKNKKVKNKKAEAKNVQPEGSGEVTSEDPESAK